MTFKHDIHLIQSANDTGVMAYVPGLDHLMYEGRTEEDALTGIKELVERYHAETRNATPPYSQMDYIRDEIQMRLSAEERRILSKFDEANGEYQVSSSDAQTLGYALLRFLGRRPPSPSRD